MKKFKPTTKKELDKEIRIAIEKKGFEVNLNYIDTSEITDMSYLFSFTNFNGKIDEWDVSNVTNMEAMFTWAINFNQHLNSWDVSNVTNMVAMFLLAEKFNQPLDSWNTKNVTNMIDIFTITNMKQLPSWYKK